MALQERDHTFDYRIPPPLVGRLAVGQRVRVPFGHRTATGYIAALGGAATIDEAKLKDIIALAGTDPGLTEDLMELTTWLADRYLCLRSQALRAMLPPGSRDGTVKPRQVRFVLPAVPPATLAAAARELKKRAPRQAALLDLSAHHPDGLIAARALAQTGSPHSSLQALVERGLLLVEEREVARDPLPTPPPPAAPLVPTADQAQCLAALEAALAAQKEQSFLLHGVTASGKTEVYLAAIRTCLAAGRTALYLVPEISLTPQSVERFHRALGSTVAVLHSGLGQGERYDQWRRIRQGDARVVVGARSAVFAPLQHIGLIILDEEHEPAFKQDETPRYHARTVAWARARRWGAVLLGGSATPSLAAWHSVHTGRCQLLTMPRRIDDRPLPTVTIIDQRDPQSGGAKALLSFPLAAALKECVAAGRQAILFLNRRGFATIVLCRECGHAEHCPHCSVALTFHRGRGRLICHYCGHRRQPPTRCPKCSGTGIGFFGAGTERVEQAVRQLLPDARVQRFDADTIGGKGGHGRVYRAFAAGEIDVLVGTQMIAKGWDVPNVTLVGVVSADTALHLPDFRSAERTLQLLMQVAGRAGRGDSPGHVFVQTFNPDHPAVTAVRTSDTETFWRHELAQRQSLGYPPYGLLVRFLATAPEEDAARIALTDLADSLKQDLPPGVQLLGPAQAPLGRLRGQFRWQLVLRGRAGVAGRDVRQWLDRVLPGRGSWRRGGARVSVDIDPVSLL